MASFDQAIFLIQFLLITVIFIYKLLNLFDGWSMYDWKGIIMLLILTIFLFGINLIITPLSYEDLYISQLSKLEILPFIAIVIFSIIESFTMVQTQLNGRGRYVAAQDGRR